MSVLFSPFFSPFDLLFPLSFVLAHLLLKLIRELGPERAIFAYINHRRRGWQELFLRGDRMGHSPSATVLMPFYPGKFYTYPGMPN